MTLHFIAETGTGPVFPVLEIGGTHVTAALVSGTTQWEVLPGTITRLQLDAHGTADDFLSVVSQAGQTLGHKHNGIWGIALPGPFDYETGTAQYENVGKFDQLKGHNLRTALTGRLSPAASLTFLNDADAFGVGEYAIGTAGNHRRAVCITLGTGIGSSFLDDGVPVKEGPSVPPEGCAYLLSHHGQPLEDAVSRRAIRAAYAAATGAGQDSDDGRPGDVRELPDVREIAQAARSGNATASRVLHEAFTALGQALSPYLESFQAEILIMGGSIAQSWDIVEPAMREGLAAAGPHVGALRISRAEQAEDAGLIGTAHWAARNGQPPAT